ncbi:FYVE, RhoGEF and PH domain-containing protein 6 isoform X2 [Gouania willdenowi]|uniref:FYVE, RhoGEF and PH domain-containing protein 6 isoform X2 n=1 Tax=Gouania willdenowi TaxID=441366 RepID=UPI001055AD79|nr:FYVE, RhoGEF and PH domain-containing protein 6-like isoform X2 [Gouania willdenowi]
MSSGVKKPPLAPKPKLPFTSKPSPPPIAPKPDHLAQPAQPSPATLKRTKPAVAPKPCLLKASPPPPKASESQDLTDRLSLLNSRNGILSERSGADSDYIIPTCSCGLEEDQCRPVENGTETGGDSHKDLVQNGTSTDETKLEEKEKASEEKEESGRTIKKPQRLRHLDRAAGNHEGARTDTAVGNQEELRTDRATENHEGSRNDRAAGNQEELRTDRATGNHEGSRTDRPPGNQEELRPDRAAEIHDWSRTDRAAGNHVEPRTVEQNVSDDVSQVSEPTGSAHTEPPPDVAGSIVESPTKNLQVEASLPEPDLQVPAAPSKPLPVPQPRRLKKPTLVRQDGVEGVGQETSDDLGDPELPVPPPRQTSLSPRLHRSAATLNKVSSPSLDLLSESDTLSHAREAEPEEDGYGDFALYPVTRSLPRKAFSSEGQQSPRAPPRKPQRHSLPAPPPPSVCPPAPPAPPHANTPMRALPAPPPERSSWRFTRPCVTFFNRQMPTRSSVPSKSRTPTLGGKQRAQSFSAADLATRTGSQRRSLSFRKLLELRLSVKMLPKLLVKGGQTLEAIRGERPNSCIVEADICRDGVESVDYENVPLYEEIPEYMNLPFHSGRLGWSHDPESEESDIYEVQDPYDSCQDQEDQDSDWPMKDSDDDVNSSDEDDGSSASSKEHLDEADRQLDEMKRKKVVHIAQEIMSSEKVFVDVLKLLHIDFRDAVANSTRHNGKPVVEERVLSQILYYLPQLYQLNRDLLRELEERVAHWSDHQRLSDIFVQKGPYLKMYSTYIRQFDNNVALLDEQCRKNTTFATVVREFELSPRCASLALKHYLLKPVQRIPQYQLLLTDYLKNLPQDSEDYKDTQAALGIVKEVANHANDIMKQGDNFQKLMHIQYSLNGHHEIVQPGRVFLKEGTLMKLSRKVMQPRMFFLFNDALMYTTPVQSGQYKLNSVLSLAGMKVSKPSQEAYQNELNIESIERSFILSASSATERDEWLEAIAKAIDDYTKKKTTFISSRSQEEAEGAVDSGAPLGSKAPIWIPDLRATMCMICTCEFTLTWRRHHCRACGKVVCQACSTNKFYLEYLKNQPARVCDHCFVKLQENSDRCASSSVSPIKSGAFSFTRKQKKIPAALKEVSANTENSSMSGYLNRSKGFKKPWKRLWFVIKNKVLYTYAASEDVAALESQPLLGFFLREEKNGPAQKLQFKLYHKNTLFHIFKADDIPTAQRWIEAFQEAMILEQ